MAIAPATNTYFYVVKIFHAVFSAYVFFQLFTDSRSLIKVGFDSAVLRTMTVIQIL